MSERPLVSLLDAEHRAIDAVVGELDGQLQLLLSGDHRHLPATSAAVEQAVEALQAATAARQLAAFDTAARLGLPGSADLATIVDAWPDPGQQAGLHRRCDAMRTSTLRLGDVLQRNRQLLAQGMAAISDALALLGVPPGYDASGAVDRLPSPPRLLDARA